MDVDHSPDLEFRHLLSFRAVAATGSFHEAAESLDYTQSAVSQHVAALEAILGVRLLDRSRGRRTVEVTEAGALLLRHADAIVARMRAARADLRRGDEQFRAVVAIDPIEIHEVGDEVAQRIYVHRVHVVR